MDIDDPADGQATWVGYRCREPHCRAESIWPTDKIARLTAYGVTEIRWEDMGLFEEDETGTGRPLEWWALA